MSWEWRMMQKLKSNWFSVQNWHEQSDEFLFKHSKISKICTLMGYRLSKYIIFYLKKYKGIMLDSKNIDAKFERKLTFAFENDMRN